MSDFAWSKPAEVEVGQLGQLEPVVEQGAELARQFVVELVEPGVVKLC